MAREVAHERPNPTYSCVSDAKSERLNLDLAIAPVEAAGYGREGDGGGGRWARASVGHRAAARAVERRAERRQRTVRYARFTDTQYQ